MTNNLLFVTVIMLMGITLYNAVMLTAQPTFNYVQGIIAVSMASSLLANAMLRNRKVRQLIAS